MADKAKKENIFSEENVKTANFWKLETPGDRIQGVYVEKKTIPNTLKPGTDQTIYTIMQDNGETIFVSGRYGANAERKQPAIIPGLESSKFGQVVGLEYTGESAREPKPGFRPAKIIKVYAPAGMMNEEALKQFHGNDPFVTDPKDIELPPM